MEFRARASTITRGGLDDMPKGVTKVEGGANIVCLPLVRRDHLGLVDARPERRHDRWIRLRALGHRLVRPSYRPVV